MCFNLFTKWKLSFTVTSVTLLWGESSWHQIDRRLAKTQSWYECGRKGKNPSLSENPSLSGNQTFITWPETIYY